MCFKWAISSALFPISKNSDRVSMYSPHEDKLNWSGLTFPVKLPQIRIFERNNINLTVNVYESESTDIVPVYLTNHTKRSAHIDLLLLTEGDKSHYVWIKSMSRLISSRSSNHRKSFVCPHCSHPFTREEAFTKHFPDCSRHVRQIVNFPDEQHDTLFWKSRAKTEFFPYVIYADFESILAPRDGVINEHLPCGFCLYVVNRDRVEHFEPILYSGPDTMDVFFSTN